MTKWQPIETAPHKGEVLVYLNGVIRQAMYSRMGGHPYTGKTWPIFITVDDWEFVPTHWRPMLDPPESEQ